MNINEKYCVTIADVYGVPFAALSAPQGYEFTGEFRPALSGEWYRKVNSDTPQKANHNSGEPRLILRALPTVESVYEGQTLEQLKENAKTAEWIGDLSLKFEWTGEFRKVQRGDYFLGAQLGRSVCLNDSGILTGEYRLIMRRCPTIKEIYGKELSELAIPEGYESTGELRVPKAGETALMANGSGTYTFCNDVSGDYRRLILRKLPTVKDVYGAPLEKLTPPIGYRFTGEFRGLRNGDSWMCPTGHACLGAYADTEMVRLILEQLPPNPTIKDVYGTDTPAIPKGWRFKEFRQVARDDEWHVPFLCQITGIVCNYGSDSSVGRWRIVLEKEVDLSTLTYTETLTVKDVYGDIPQVPLGYNVIGFRPPKAGDVLLTSWDRVETADSDWNSPYLILSPLGPR